MNIFSKTLYWFYKLSWKKVVGLGMLALAIAVVPVSLQSVTNQTRTKSQAALIHPSVQPITQEFKTPQGPPKIYLVDHFFGKVGDSVLIHGENLGGLHGESWVSLGGIKIEEENLVSWTGSYIEFKVPTGARSGRVEINILGQKTSWPGMFFVVDESTTTEVNLIKNQNNLDQAVLTGINLEKGQELLVWLLIINGESELKLTAASNVRISSSIIKMPLGRIYEVKLSLRENLTKSSIQQAVDLLTVTKTENQLVGIARAELSTADDKIIPLKINPLYVSF